VCLDHDHDRWRTHRVCVVVGWLTYTVELRGHSNSMAGPGGPRHRSLEGPRQLQPALGQRA
jgi:hypothetical protein